MPENGYKTRLVNAIHNSINNSQYLSNTIHSDQEDIPNEKWQDFIDTGIRRNEALLNNSVTHGLHVQGRNNLPVSGGYGNLDTNYYNRVYSPLDGSKANRIYEYRTMAAYPTVQDCIIQISNNFITEDERGKCIHFTYSDPEMNVDSVKILSDNFDSFVRIFDFINNGKKYCQDYLIDGEVFLELIINTERPENKSLGILGVVKMPTELVDVIYKDKYNDVVSAFVGQQITEDGTRNIAQVIKTKPVFLAPNQVFYVNSGERDPSGEYIVPFINRGRKRYIQLSFLEDAIVIYRLARAPERLVITADCGNLPPDKAEEYLQRLKHAMYKNMNFDPNNGDIMQRYSPASMMDAFWIAKTAGNEGINITTLPGGQNLGELSDLNYFKKALYEALCVPTSRLEKGQAQASIDNSTILQEELQFAEITIDIQRKFAQAVKQAWITHLKYMGLYQEYKLQEKFIDIKFEPPSHYYKLRRLQGIQIAGSAFSALASNDVLSKSYLMKYIMGMSETDIAAQYKLRKQEAMHEFEIGQIQNNGPNWKAAALAETIGNLGGGEGGGGEGGFGGGEFGGGGDFGGGGEFGGGEDFGGGEEMGGGEEEMGGAEENPGGEEPV